MDKNMMGWLHVLAFVLVVVGALNWGLMGAFNINLVTWIFGVGGVTNLVYILVGLSALYLLLMHQKDCRTCEMLMKPSKKKRR